jgi:uncharacterized membrane protein
MGLLNTKVWSWVDIWILKWSAFLFGIAGGAYFSDFIRPYIWIIAVVAVLLAIRPGFMYFRNDR